MPEPSDEALRAPKLITAMPRPEAARAMAQRILDSISSPEPSNILAIMRAASTKPEAAPQLRDVFVRRMMLPMMIELGLSRPHERAVLLASLVTGLTFVHTMLDIRSEWPDFDRSAELKLISAAVELVLTIEIP